MTSVFTPVLALLLCSAVQGSDISGLGDKLKGHHDWKMPDIASILQQHVHGNNADSSKTHSPWRKQAEMFLGLLQGMGKQVPEKDREEVTGYVNQIIDLLTGSKDDIYAEALNTSIRIQTQINTELEELQNQETAANTALDVTEGLDADLGACYAQLHAIAGNHSVHCGEKELPPPCVRKNNTRRHRFEVASKDTWKCNFTAGSDPTTCTAPTSPLTSDLTSNKATLMAAYHTWKLDNATCQADLDAEHELCQSTNNSYWGQESQCGGIYTSAMEHLCNFRDKVNKWTEALVTLQATQTMAPGLLPPKKTEWLDLNLIICMLKAFRDRQPAMTFTAEDYTTCEAHAGTYQFVEEINTKVPETTTLTSGSKYDTTCLKVQFTGGLAEKFMAERNTQYTHVEFFTPPKTDDRERMFHMYGAGDSPPEDPFCFLRPASTAGAKVCNDGMPA